MSRLETAMGLLMQTFDEYAGAEGKKGSLNKGELKAMMKKEMPGLIENAKNPQAVDELMKNLDHNNDAEVDFNEFVVLIAAMTSVCHGLKK